MHFWRHNSCLRDAENGENHALFLWIYNDEQLALVVNAHYQRVFLFRRCPNTPIDRVLAAAGRPK